MLGLLLLSPGISRRKIARCGNFLSFFNMIIYDLICENDHRFEGWFKNRDDFLRQQQQFLLCCPVCESGGIRSLPSASQVQDSKKRMEIRAIEQVEARTLLNQLHDYVDSQCENVGRGFADEVRKIHYGETPQRAIKGEVSISEANELKEEGVPIMTLPPRPIDKDKLN